MKNERLKRIKEVVELVFKVDDISEKRRFRRISEARQAYYYMARQTTNIGLREIGEFVGFDHSTVIHGHKKVNDLISIDEDYKKKIERIESSLNESKDKHDLEIEFLKVNNKFKLLRKKRNYLAKRIKELG